MRFVFILIILLCPATVAAKIVKANPANHCALTKTLNIEQLVDSAGIIFRGKLNSMSYGSHNGLRVRKLNFNIDEAIRGVKPGAKTITLREWASVRTPFTANVRSGRSYVFFFHNPSKLGLTSLIGMDQGLVGIDAKGSLNYSKRLSLRDIGLFKTRIASGTGSSARDIMTYSGLKKYCKLRM